MYANLNYFAINEQAAFVIGYGRTNGCVDLVVVKKKTKMASDQTAAK